VWKSKTDYRTELIVEQGLSCDVQKAATGFAEIVESRGRLDIFTSGLLICRE